MAKKIVLLASAVQDARNAFEAAVQGANNAANNANDAANAANKVYNNIDEALQKDGYIVTLINDAKSARDAAETAASNATTAANAASQAASDAQVNYQQVQSAINEVMTTSPEIDPDFISYDIGVMPDPTGAITGETIGLYYTEGGLLKKIRWDGSEWEEIGEGVPTRSGLGYINVKWFDAKGDGITDDTDAFMSAMSHLNDLGGGKLVIPSGVYIITNTIRIPANTTVEGENRKDTVIKAGIEANFELITPLEWTSMPDRYKLFTMLTTASAGDNGDDTRIEGVAIKNLTVDYNSLPAGNYSVAPIIIDRAERAYLEEVEVVNAVASDIPVGTTHSGSCILFSFARDCECNRVYLHAADYESLSVRYLSKNILFHHGSIISDKPEGPREQAHLAQIARPTPARHELLLRYGEEKSQNLFITDCNLYVNNRTRNIATSHHSDGFYVWDCNIEFLASDPFDFRVHGLKSFDNTNETSFLNNKLDYRNFSGTKLPILLAIDDGQGLYNSNSNFKISNNLILLRFPDGFSADPDDLNHRPLVGGFIEGPHFTGEINDNQIKIENYPNEPIKVIGIWGNRISIDRNRVWLISPAETITENGPIITFIGAGSWDGSVSGNTAAQYPYSHGIVFEPVHSGRNRVDNYVAIGNRFSYATADAIFGIRNVNTINVQGNLPSLNMVRELTFFDLAEITFKVLEGKTAFVFAYTQNASRHILMHSYRTGNDSIVVNEISSSGITAVGSTDGSREVTLTTSDTRDWAVIQLSGDANII